MAVAELPVDGQDGVHGQHGLVDLELAAMEQCPGFEERGLEVLVAGAALERLRCPSERPLGGSDLVGREVGDDEIERHVAAEVLQVALVFLPGLDPGGQEVGEDVPGGPELRVEGAPLPAQVGQGPAAGHAAQPARRVEDLLDAFPGEPFQGLFIERFRALVQRGPGLRGIGMLAQVGLFP